MVFLIKNKLQVSVAYCQKNVLWRADMALFQLLNVVPVMERSVRYGISSFYGVWL